MATVLRMVTLSTVKIRLRSECSFFGRTAAIAMAADAPQIATEPPVNKASRHPRPKSRDPTRAEEDGQAITPTTTKAINSGPRSD